MAVPSPMPANGTQLQDVFHNQKPIITIKGTSAKTPVIQESITQSSFFYGIPERSPKAGFLNARHDPQKVVITVQPISPCEFDDPYFPTSPSRTVTDKDIDSSIPADVYQKQPIVPASPSNEEEGHQVKSGFQLQVKPSNPSAFAKSREYAAFLRSGIRTYASELRSPYQSVSAQGSFTHYVAVPLYQWFGQNRRIVLSQPLGKIHLQPCDPKAVAEGPLINGTSINYAGMYGMPSEYEELHRKCLETLPLADSRAVKFIEETLRSKVADFLGMDSYFLAPTGYQGNILAMTAILDDSWVVVMDRKSHSSLFAAVYLAGVARIEKFAHNDMAELEKTLDQLGNTKILVVVEGMYSLDATLPHLGQLARLKQNYGFTLYCDEAHSFGSIGRTGGGVLEWWNDMHPHNPLPNALFDIRTATFSKAIAGAGGFVCANARFDQQLHTRSLKLIAEGGETLATPVMLHALWFLSQPVRLRRNLARLRAMSLYVHRELRAAGIFTYGDESAPIVPIHAGRPSKACELSYVLRQCGVAATPFSKPAVPIWQSRVRLGLSAEFSDEDVTGLVKGIIEACKQVGLKPGLQQRTTPFQTTLADEYHLLKAEQASILQELHSLIDVVSKQLEDAPFPSPRKCSVLEAGHRARAQYGLGAGSARWILGTYPEHLNSEQHIATMLRQQSAMTYTNSEAGLMSTVAALCRPLKSCARHCFLVPTQASPGVENGIKLAPRRSGTAVLRYQDWNDLILQMVDLAGEGRVHVTLCLDASVIDPTLARRVGPLCRRFAGVTLLWSDCTTAGLYNQRMDCAGKGVFATLAVALKARTLIYGSFYHTFGLNGGYLAGDATLLEELRYTSRCYVFTGASPPYVMAMVAEELRQRLADSD